MNSKNYFSIHVLILSAREQLLKGKVEHDKKDFIEALSCYTEGIELQCKDDKLNAELHIRRAHSHSHLGELKYPS